MINDRTATGPPSTTSRSSRFLGCFGYSGEKIIELTDEVNLSSPNRSRRWSFGCKKSSTEIVDFTTVHRKSKSVKESSTKTDETLTKTHVIISDEQKSISRKKWTDIVKRENGSFRTRRKEPKPAEISATVTDVKSVIVKREKGSSRTGRKETKPADTSVTGGVELPEKKTLSIGNSLVSSNLQPLTHSKSLPVIKKQKHWKAPSAGGGVGGGVDDGVMHKSPLSGGDFDSIIAMSILLTILVIMVLWGKICAIFCTCAWFLVAPRLVADGEYSKVAVTEGRRPELQEDLNLESEEYKKKVVLEGFLQRNHRNVVGRL